MAAMEGAANMLIPEVVLLATGRYYWRIYDTSKPHPFGAGPWGKHLVVADSETHYETYERALISARRKVKKLEQAADNSILNHEAAMPESGGAFVR